MPMIDVKTSPGALDAAAKQDLADKLTATLLKWEKAPDNDVTRAITWVYFTEADTFVGGRPADRPRWHVLVTVPDGALSERRKEGLIQEATEIIAAADGDTSEDFLNRVRYWVHIHEVPEGHWGAAGQVFRYKQIVDHVRAGSQQAAGAAS